MVVMPFLPGDSLLFVVGAMCGVGLMNYPLSVGLLGGVDVAVPEAYYLEARALLDEAPDFWDELESGDEDAPDDEEV